MRALLGRAARLLITVFLLVALVQIGFFFYFERVAGPLSPADLVVVFAGDAARITVGCGLASQGLGSRLMVINQTAARLDRTARKNGVPETVILLSGGESRSSFEDVFNTVQAIETYSLKSVILVTSAYHLPRSFYLLKGHLALQGRKVAVQYLAVQDKHLLGKRLQVYYNEVLKLWGSSFEMAGFFLTKKLMLDSPRVLKVRKWLKDTLLFNV